MTYLEYREQKNIKTNELEKLFLKKGYLLDNMNKYDDWKKEIDNKIQEIKELENDFGRFL